MVFIYIIIAFLLGIVFTQWIVPLVDGILGLFLTQLEVWKGHMAVKISKDQKTVENMKQKSDEEEHSSPIGFVVLEEEDDTND